MNGTARRGLWLEFIEESMEARRRRQRRGRQHMEPITVLKLLKDAPHSISSYFANDFGQGLIGSPGQS